MTKCINFNIFINADAKINFIVFINKTKQYIETVEIIKSRIL